MASVQSINGGQGHHDSDKLSPGLIRIGKGRQVLRVVNAADDSVRFSFRRGSNLSDFGLTINPQTGIIPPRDFIHVILDTFGNQPKIEGGRIELLHWRRDLKRKKGHIKGLLSFDVIDTRIDESFYARNKSFIWLIMRIVRSIFLVLLITYNIILIKFLID